METFFFCVCLFCFSCCCFPLMARLTCVYKNVARDSSTSHSCKSHGKPFQIDEIAHHVSSQACESFLIRLN